MEDDSFEEYAAKIEREMNDAVNETSPSKSSFSKNKNTLIDVSSDDDNDGIDADERELARYGGELGETLKGTNSSPQKVRKNSTTTLLDGLLNEINDADGSGTRNFTVHTSNTSSTFDAELEDLFTMASELEISSTLSQSKTTDASAGHGKGGADKGDVGCGTSSTLQDDLAFLEAMSPPNIQKPPANSSPTPKRAKTGSPPLQAMENILAQLSVETVNGMVGEVMAAALEEEEADVEKKLIPQTVLKSNVFNDPQAGERDLIDETAREYNSPQAKDSLAGNAPSAYAGWADEEDEWGDVVSIKEVSELPNGTDNVLIDEIPTSQAQKLLAVDISIWNDGPRTTTAGLNSSYYYPRRPSNKGKVPSGQLAALKYVADEYSTLHVVEIIVRPDVPVGELLTAVREVFVDDNNDISLKDIKNGSEESIELFSWACNEMINENSTQSTMGTECESDAAAEQHTADVLSNADRAVIRYTGRASEKKNSSVLNTFGSVLGDWGILGGSGDKSEDPKVKTKHTSEWDLLEAHVCISRDLRHRALLLRFYVHQNNISAAQDDVAPHAHILGANNLQLPFEHHLLKASPCTAAMLGRLTSILTSQQLSLSSLYDSRVEDVCSILDAGEGSMPMSGFDDHYYRQLSGLCKEKMLVSVRESFKALDEYLAVYERRAATFVSMMTPMLNAHDVPIPVYARPPPLEVVPGDDYSDEVLASVGIGRVDDSVVEEHANENTMQETPAAPSGDTNRTEDGMSLFLSKFTSFTDAVQHQVDKKMARSVDVKNKVVIQHITALAAFKRAIVGAIVFNVENSMTSSIGQAFTASFGCIEVNGASFNNIIFEEQLPRPSDGNNDFILDGTSDTDTNAKLELDPSSEEQPVGDALKSVDPDAARAAPDPISSNDGGFFNTVSNWFSSSSVVADSTEQKVEEKSDTSANKSSSSVPETARNIQKPSQSKAALMKARLEALRGGGTSGTAITDSGDVTVTPEKRLKSVEYSDSAASGASLQAKDSSLSPSQLVAKRTEERAAQKPNDTAESTSVAAPGPALVSPQSPVRERGLNLTDGRKRFNSNNDAVVLYYCNGLVNGMSPGTLYITQSHLCLIFGLTLSSTREAQAGGVQARTTTSPLRSPTNRNRGSTLGNELPRYDTRSPDRGGMDGGVEVATGEAAFVNSVFSQSEEMSPKPKELSEDTSGSVSVTQTKKVYSLTKLGTLRMEHGGMLTSGTLILPFFQGATEIRFAPTFVDCARLMSCVGDIVEALKDIG